MRPNLPTLGGPPKRNPFGPVVAVSVILGAAAGGVWWWKQRMPDVPMDGAASQAATPVDAGSVAQAPSATPPAPTDPVKAAGLERASIRIEGPLETALVQAAGAEVGPALAQVVTRTLVWWVRVPGEILRGDTLDVLYQRRPNEEPLVYAVRFISGKTGQTHRAYRFQPGGETNARYYVPNGDELELRMEHSPIDSYEQITSLLRDGRGHKGVDFRAPVGTTVRAPFAGVVKRKNWNFGSNGNCIELIESGGKGRRALFLHLAELPKSVQAGLRVSAGQVLAQSGNTGHSFAPHLHYQLMLGENRVLDPFDQHKTFRAALTATQKGAFEAEVQRLDGLLGTSVAGK